MKECLDQHIIVHNRIRLFPTLSNMPAFDPDGVSGEFISMQEEAKPSIGSMDVPCLRKWLEINISLAAK